MLDLTNEQISAFRDYLTSTLETIKEDVHELLTVIPASENELLPIDELVAVDVSINSPRDATIRYLSYAYRLAEKGLKELAEGVETEVIVTIAFECERNVKRCAGGLLGVTLGTLHKSDLEIREIRERRRTQASEAGRASGKTRAESVRCTPDKVANDYQTMMATGTEERNIASILAKRYSVTSDHIRKLRKAGSKNNAT